MKNNTLSKWEWLQVALSVIFFCLLCLGQLERWQVSTSIAVYAHDLVLILLLSLNGRWWHKEVSHQKTSYQLRKEWPLVILLGWAGVGWLLALISGDPLLVAVLYLGRLLAYLALNWQLLNATWWPKILPWMKGSERLLSAYWLLGLFTMYFGFLQYLLIPDIRFMGTLGWDVHLFRLVSVQLDPNITGALLIITLLLTLHLSFLKPTWRLVLSLLVTGAIALTYSRSTYGATVVGLLSWAFIKRRDTWQLKWSLGLIAALLVLILFLPHPGGEGVKLDRTASGVARMDVAQSTLSHMSNLEWVVGRGLFMPGAFTTPSTVILGQHAQLADNLVILVLSGLGIGGLVLLTGILYHYRRALGQLSLLATTSMIAILAHSQFNNTLFQPFVWLMLSAIILSSFKYQTART